MKLILVRHGETIWNKEHKIQGITDIGLNERGIEQAKKLACSLQKEELDAIITSPLRRAYDTAQAIGKYHDISITVEEDLQELNAGELEGLTWPELDKYPEFFGKWKLDHASVAMPNGESLVEVQNRVWPVIQRISETFQNALIVSHSFVIISILCKIQNLNLSHSANLRIGASSKTCVDIENGSGTVLYFNDTEHLCDN
ncbi:MAG: histidine phosphatase family protein [Syntrophales bacterium]|nr:histidine phosphatase family protein [Syntrophales bacterium]